MHIVSYQVVAQYFDLFITAATCFGLSYWPFSGSSLIFRLVRFMR